MDRLTSLATFVAAAEARSFTAAGRKLGISSSAVGKAIARLEQRLGVRLFHRSTRSVALTADGEAFLRRCQRILGELEAAEAEMAQSSAEPRGRLKISMPLVHDLLTPALAAFARTYPAVELELDFSDRLVDVIEEGFDAVIRTGDAVDSRLMNRMLGSFPYAIVASPAYLAARGTPETPEELAGHSCLRHRWTATGKLESWRLTRDGAYLDLEPPATVVANAIEPLIDLAEGGVGLTCVPAFWVRRQIAAGLLVPVLGRFRRDAGALRMLWPPDRQLTLRLRAFIDFMGRTLSADLTN
jgi:DNA-binding transcriptional LysR family regulator